MVCKNRGVYGFVSTSWVLITTPTFFIVELMPAQARGYPRLSVDKHRVNGDQCAHPRLKQETERLRTAFHVGSHPGESIFRVLLF